MRNAPSNTDDVIDSRDVIERIAELESEREERDKLGALFAAAPLMRDTLQSFEDAFGELVDTDADINGADAVEFIAAYLVDVRAAIAKAGG